MDGAANFAMMALSFDLFIFALGKPIVRRRL